MLFNFEERLSNSPFVEKIWRTQSERTGDFLSVAASQWEMVISKYQGETTITVRGPETKATLRHVNRMGGEFFGIIFKYGTFMPHLPLSNLVNVDLDLPDASCKSFWLNGSAWQFPNYENADVFVEALARENLIVCDPVIAPVLRGEPQALSPRSVQRRFIHTTGLTQRYIRKIERARHATILLHQGVSILDTVEQAGYSDQAHLTRALKFLIGKTPAQIINRNEPEQMSFSFKTEPAS